MRIAVCGSHGVGKTSLVRTCASALELVHPGRVAAIGEVARKVIAMGLPLNRDATVESYYQYVRLQLRSERTAIAPFVLSDRCLVDMLAYLEVDAGGLPPAFAEMLAEVAWSDARAFDAFAYVPIEYPLEPDGVRSPDVGYQHDVDARVLDIMRRWDLPTVTVSGSVDDRCETLLRMFEGV